VNKQLLALHLERGRLQERIAQQRVALCHELLPLVNAATAASRVMAAGQQAAGFVKSNPLLILAGLLTAFVLRPRGVWRLTKTGLVIWRGGRALLALLPAPVLLSLYQMMTQRFTNK
jgi:hypothetical protein